MGYLEFTDKELIVIFMWNKPLSKENSVTNLHINTAFTNRTVSSSELLLRSKHNLKPPFYNRIRNSNTAQ